MTFATADAPNIQASGDILRNQGLNGICEPLLLRRSARFSENEAARIGTFYRGISRRYVRTSAEAAGQGARGRPERQSVEEWNELAKENGINTKQRHYEARMALKDKGLVREYAGRWKVSV
jgi:hypothetical protein